MYRVSTELGSNLGYIYVQPPIRTSAEYRLALGVLDVNVAEISESRTVVEHLRSHDINSPTGPRTRFNILTVSAEELSVLAASLDTALNMVNH